MALTLQEPTFHNSSAIPLIVRPGGEENGLETFFSEIKTLVEEHLHQRGALLFRGFKVNGVEGFEDFVKSFGSELLSYTHRSTPRSKVSGQVYTSTEYPAKQTIPLHNEMAYTKSWPLKLWFYSMLTAHTGGETPLADSREVWRRIPEELREKFTEKKLIYVRNYRIGMDIPWQETFNTEDKSEVEAYCRKNDLEFEWRKGNELRTRQLVQGTALHPVTGEPVWFNQAHLFHISNLESRFREAMKSLYKDDELPRNVLYGDNSIIPDEDLDQVRKVLDQCKVVFPWEAGDVLLLDNMLTAHARQPFEGDRRVVVAMTEGYP